MHETCLPCLVVRHAMPSCPACNAKLPCHALPITLELPLPAHRSSDMRRFGRCTCALQALCMASAALMATSTSAGEASSAVQAAQGRVQ